MADDTIFAHSSGAPPAAIAVIRISGPVAHAAASRLCGPLPEPRQVALRELRGEGGELLDAGLVLRFDAPASATGEDLVELHCHGGRAVVSAVLRALGQTEGLREALPGEFTRRALLNGRMDLTEAEGLADLLAAETEAQRRAAVSIAGGAIRRQVEQWRRRLLDLSARAEAAIDYVDEEQETSSDTQELGRSARSLGGEVGEWLSRPRAEPLQRGVRVVLAGPPNAGKSTLLNALVGVDRAIVSAEAGTTRDVIEVPLAAEGIPLVLVDTAGLRAGESAIEGEGIRRAQRQVEAADVLLWLGDPEESPGHARLIKVHAQADRPERATAPPSTLAVSAHSGQGVGKLLNAVLNQARDLLPAADVVPLNARQATALSVVAEVLQHAHGDDLLLLADDLRRAREALDGVTGHAGIEDVLDALFGRFCLGK